MKPLKILIHCEPTAKGRPRTKMLNGKVFTYTPTKTAEAQAFIASVVQEHKSKCFPPHTPVKFTATFYRTKSKWLPRKEDKPVRKPDLTNFEHLLEDGFNHILVADDAQVTSKITRKRWSKRPYGYITLKLEVDGGE